MASSGVTLRYGGGGSLTFADATGARRRVLGGTTFTTDERTAWLLLRDPFVTRVVDEPATAEGASPPFSIVPAADLDELTVARLREQASALGVDVPARARKNDLIMAIAEHRGRQAVVDLVAEAKAVLAEVPDEGGTDTPAEEPDATPPVDEEGDPLPPPAPSSAGTISLGDLPPGARRPPSQGGLA